MKKYIVEVSETAEQDLENIISYLRDDLAEDIIADKYKILFKQKLNSLENIAGSMPLLYKELTGHEDIRKLNVRNYIIFYVIDEENSKALVLRVGHAFMDWEKYLKLSYIDSEAPDIVTIKSKRDLKEKLQAGLDDIEADRVYSLDEVLAKIDSL